MDREIEGTQILRWLRQADSDSASRFLVGSLVYDPDKDDETEILEVRLDEQILICSGVNAIRRVHFNVLPKRIIIDRSDHFQLSSRIDGSRPPLTASDLLFMETKKLGGAPKIANETDAATLLQVIELFKSETLPSEKLRHLVFELVKKHRLFKIGKVLSDQWAKAALKSGPPYYADIYIQIAFYSRAFHDAARAIRATDVLFLDGRLQCNPNQRAILETIRGAALLDTFLEEQDPEKLTLCRKHLGRAWALTQSEFTSFVYRRLTSYENAFAARESRRFWKAQFGRVGDPDDLAVHSY